MHNIVIIGGGWAGLSAAITLAENNHKVTILEASPQLGGRARGVQFGESWVDNGQHLLLNSYTSLMQLWRKLGIGEHKLYISPLELPFYSDKLQYNLKCNNVLPPFDKIITILCNNNFTIKDKFNIFKFIYRKTAHDTTVLDAAKKSMQPRKLIDNLWGPLCLAALTTPAHNASYKIFQNVLQQSVGKLFYNCKQILAKTHLSDLLPNPVRDFLQRNGSKIFLNTRVKEIVEDRDGFKIITRSDEFEAQHVIIATSPFHIPKLPNCSGTDKLKNDLRNYVASPITTVYLEYNCAVNLPHYHFGTKYDYAEWVFDRKINMQPNMVATVISGDGEHIGQSSDKIAKLANNAINKFLPRGVTLKNYKVIKEKFAAYQAIPNIYNHTPSQRTPLDILRTPHVISPHNTKWTPHNKNTPQKVLWLAGDYTYSKFPATLEAAVRSGIECANKLIKEIK